MKAYLECYPCFISQALKTARLLSKDDKDIKRILDAVCSSLPKISFEATPAEIGREVYRIISEISGIHDPYREIKKNCIRKALELYPYLKEKVKEADDPLLAAVRVAIAGNVIDFGANRDFELEKDVEQILHQPFAVNHYSEFKKGLEKAGEILFIADNAGETVFDRVLIEEFKKPVVYAVREKPVINDAVEEDAVASGLDKISRIVSSGVDAPGTILNLCHSSFQELFFSADLVISKGQGNYEGLSGVERQVFFLLKAKCPVIADDISVPQGSILLIDSAKIKRK